MTLGGGPLDGALLEAVRVHPEADGPRLAVADALEAAGNGTADLIRVQCELSVLPRWDPARPALEARGRDLENRYAETWVTALGVPPVEVRLQRGFPGKAELTPGELLEHGRELTGKTPLVEIDISFDEEDLPDPALDALPDLDFVGAVHTLAFSDAWIPPESFGAILSSEAWAGVRTLMLGPPMCEPDMVRSLAAASARPPLTSMELWGGMHGVGDAGVVSVVTCADLPLERLALLSQAIGDDGVRAIISGPACAGLRELVLSTSSYAENTFTERSMSRLDEAPWLENLRTLAVGMMPVGSAVVGALGGTSRLTRLSLPRSGLGVADLERLMALPLWTDLEELTLGANSLGTRGAACLAAADRLPTVLDLKNCDIDGEALRVLSQAPGVGALDLRWNPLHEDDWRALLREGMLPRCRSLAADVRGWSSDLVEALRSHYPRVDLA